MMNKKYRMRINCLLLLRMLFVLLWDTIGIGNRSLRNSRGGTGFWRGWVVSFKLNYSLNINIWD